MSYQLLGGVKTCVARTHDPPVGIDLNVVLEVRYMKIEELPSVPEPEPGVPIGPGLPLSPGGPSN